MFAQMMRPRPVPVASEDERERAFFHEHFGFACTVLRMSAATKQYGAVEGLILLPCDYKSGDVGRSQRGAKEMLATEVQTSDAILLPQWYPDIRPGMRVEVWRKGEFIKRLIINDVLAQKHGTQTFLVIGPVK